MAKNIRGNRDGENGENLSYTVTGRGVVSRPQLVQEVKDGQHPDFNVIKVNNVEYVRANPDSSTSNNINKD